MCQLLPRLLIVAYAYPPLATIGAIRPLTLAHEAVKEGWDVTVLTVSNDPTFSKDSSAVSPVRTARAMRIPFSYFTRWLKFILPGKEMLWSVMDYQHDWVPTAIKRGKRLYKSWPYDVVFSTAPPFSNLRVGGALAEHFNLPSVADLRDPFINNFTRDFLHPWIWGFWKRYYYKLLSKFSEIIIVDDCIRDELYGLPHHLIRNGYDEDEFSGTPPERFSQFTIGFIGTIYKEFNLKPLFRAFELLPDHIHRNARLLFVGKASELAAKRAEEFGLSRVETMPVVPRKEALEIMKRCHVLVSFGSDAIGTKIYEYARTGAKSIHIYETKSQHSYEFAEKYGLATSIRADRPAEIADEITAAYRHDSYDYPESTRRFTRRAAAREILGILKELVD
jgi:glycosyltransferase involved in cell wall biosynthesis